MSERNNQITGNIGLYYVCYLLSRHGWNAMPTSKNAEGIDLVVYKPGSNKYLGIQVKTLSKKSYSVPISRTFERAGGDAWVIVNLEKKADSNVEKAPQAYIMTSKEVDERIVTHPSGAKSVNPGDYTQPQFRDINKRLEEILKKK